MIVGGQCKWLKLIISYKTKKLYGRDMDKDKLEIHLKMIPDGIPWMISLARDLLEFRLLVTF